jgi:hypothetical protein
MWRGHQILPNEVQIPEMPDVFCVQFVAADIRGKSSESSAGAMIETGQQAKNRWPAMTLLSGTALPQQMLGPNTKVCCAGRHRRILEQRWV